MTGDYKLSEGVLYIAPETQYIRSQIYCTKNDVKRIVIPEGVGFMEDECFAECGELESVSLPEGLINIGPAAFADCPKLREINIPSTVKSIDTGAFFACTELKSITLPKGLETVSEMAFQESGIESILIPESVKAVEASAFFSCENLRRADVLNKNAEIGQDAFGSSYFLVEGYIAPGYPACCDSAAELLYTLLWCSCPEKHGEAVCRRAEAFIRAKEELIMERVLKYNNIPALSGIAARGLLSPEIISTALQTALKEGQTEITALLLEAKNAAASDEEEFEL
ncbi:MAG: leucine-rich repeat domain-containing protein [Bacillota bacterium]|nr:leucine-rich repeat domain-containing protein [Bacillota bacterium]